MWFRGLYSYRQWVRFITLFPNNVFLLLLHVEQVCKSFWKESWRVQVAHLHNDARALSSRSRCFQLSTNLKAKISFVIFMLWYKTNRMWLSLVCILLGSRVGVVVRALAFHQCVPGSIPGPGVIFGLSLLVLYSAPRGFSPGTPVFPSPQKPTFDLIWFIWFTVSPISTALVLG